MAGLNQEQAEMVFIMRVRNEVAIVAALLRTIIVPQAKALFKQRWDAGDYSLEVPEIDALAASYIDSLTLGEVKELAEETDVQG